MAENWHTFGDRLRWAYERQPSVGRQRGLRLFQRRMEEHAPADLPTSLSAIQGYLRGDSEPSPSFVELAARLLAVRPGWLAWGIGAPTEEDEADRREIAEKDLQQVSTAVYEALGVPVTLPAGTRTLLHPDGLPTAAKRFRGPAPWAPLVRRTALRLYQYRPAWELLAGREPGEEDPDTRFGQAVEDLATALAAPLQHLGMDASHLSLEDVGDLVSSVALALQRTMYRYAPEQEEENDA